MRPRSARRQDRGVRQASRATSRAGAAHPLQVRDDLVDGVSEGPVTDEVGHERQRDALGVHVVELGPEHDVQRAVGQAAHTGDEPRPVHDAAEALITEADSIEGIESARRGERQTMLGPDPRPWDDLRRDRGSITPPGSGDAPIESVGPGPPVRSDQLAVMTRTARGGYHRTARSPSDGARLDDR